MPARPRRVTVKASDLIPTDFRVVVKGPYPLDTELWYQDKPLRSGVYGVDVRARVDEVASLTIWAHSVVADVVPEVVTLAGTCPDCGGAVRIPLGLREEGGDGGSATV